jgi:hypothetical protein
MATSKVENSAKVSSCLMKFVHESVNLGSEVVVLVKLVKRLSLDVVTHCKK